MIYLIGGICLAVGYILGVVQIVRHLKKDEIINDRMSYYLGGVPK